MEELYKKDLHDPDSPDDVITNLEPDILECEVKWASESITTNKGPGVLMVSYLFSLGVYAASLLDICSALHQKLLLLLLLLLLSRFSRVQLCVTP